MRRFVAIFWVILLAGCGGGGGGGVAPVVPDPPASFEVLSVVPTDNQVGILVNGTVRVTFNQAVDSSTLQAGITAASYIDDLPGTVTYSAATNTATFTPGTQFAPLTEYTVTVGTSVRSAAGDPLAVPHIFSFTTESSFLAYDFTSGEDYLVAAQKVGEGAHCYVYVETGRTVEAATVDALIDQFDNAIYHNIVANFGNEPNPGADGLGKIFILLLDIRDGYIPGGGYIAGYFYGLNEESNVVVYPYRSNQKEVFFMDINPGNPALPGFYKSLAHEFQHMVHWEQKEGDITWLDEAMSEIAPFYAGYGANYDRIYTFESETNRSDSLTIWGSQLKDYAVAYMWAQYMADRFPPTSFKDILANPYTGIDSVNHYLSTLDPTYSFSSVFRDWSIAVFSGNAVTWPGHPEWTYTTINTWPGTYGGIPLPGLLSAGNRNTAALPALSAWSIDLYWYTSLSGSPALTWIAGGSPAPQASFYDWDAGGALTFDMVSGTPYLYDNAAVLILQNAGGATTSSSAATNPAILDSASTVLSPAAKLMAVSGSRASKSLSEATGEPVPVCMQDFLARRAKSIRQLVKEKRNAR